MANSDVPGYTYDADPARVALDVVWDFLSGEAYWGRWRTREDTAAQLRSAWRLIGVYAEDNGAMVGFARAVSDGVALAYLADVFVLPAHRGRGLGHALVRQMIDDGPGAEFRWLLHTADAHRLYADFGFQLPDETLLERPAALRVAVEQQASDEQSARAEHSRRTSDVAGPPSR